ncbi:MAG: leucyl aminopeptidase family protein [Rhodobacteraceae bacterium]|nr:leucyl aminopeptidase family protein [Paracoccaceae bacterium]
MRARFAARTDKAIPLILLTPDRLKGVLSSLPEAQAAWARLHDFCAKSGSRLVLPGPDGSADRVLIGLGDTAARARTRFAAGAAIAALPKGVYRAVADDLPRTLAEEVAFGYLLSCYRFDAYRSQSRVKAGLVPPSNVDSAALERMAEAEFLTRDLINTPAEDMGPDELEAAARDLARQFGANLKKTEGDDLLAANFPLIHTVGRAAARAPRLLDLGWGTAGPHVTLVGKGVCFDTGGLNLKPGVSMGLMKKDMGGAAAVLGLAQMIMAANLPVRLRVLIPAVENAVSGAAFRPGDIPKARNGMTVEINSTDAEGRLVLADTLALAAETPPNLLVSMATLTGAARVALGPDLAPFYTDDDGVAAALSAAGTRVFDPMWRMPFHAPYEAMIEPGIADLNNAPKGGFAGSITAALFLRRFTAGVAPYVHLDIYGWQPSAAPGRPKGGAGQGARGLFHALPEVLRL